MYTNIFYFIIVFCLFTFYEPPETPVLTESDTLLCILLVLLGYYVFIRGLFNAFERKCRHHPDALNTFSTRHSRVIATGTVAAICVYAGVVYLLDYKGLLLQIPLIHLSESGLNILGLAPFFVLLLIDWSCALPSYQKYYDRQVSIKEYLGSHFRMNVAIVLPWLIFSVLYDAAQILPDRLIQVFENNAVAGYGLFGLVFFAIVCFFPWVLTRIWHCDPLPQGRLREKVESFCRKAGFEFSDILLWNLFDGKLITAGVVGLIKSCRYLLISPTLLQILDEDELEAVVAHEIGHVRKRHMLFYVFFILGFMFLSYIVYRLAFIGLLSQDALVDFFLTNSERLKPVTVLLPVGVFVCMLLLYFRFLFGVFSRNFERQSDAYAVRLKGNARGITSSLDKIAGTGSHSRTAPNWHHFSIQQRSDFLKSCEADPSRMQKHDRKVRKMVTGYIGLLAVFVIVFYVLEGSVLSDYELGLDQRIVERQLLKTPDDPALHFVLGNIYLGKKLFLKAEKEYLVTLGLNPHQPEVLNNLAWLYATCENRAVRKPKEALKYARLAAAMDPRPHILDTLAESYYVNGEYAKAVEVEKKALERQSGDQPHFQNQMKKYLKKYHGDRLEKGLGTGEYIAL